LGKAQALPSAADAAHKTLVFKRFIEDWYYYTAFPSFFKEKITPPAHSA